MAVPVKRYKRHKKIGDTTSPVYNYLRQEPGSYKVITMDKIAKRMERAGALSAQDALHTIQNFIIELKEELVEGNKVKVDGLGTFHITFACEGTEAEKDCTVKKIKRVNVRFFVDNSLRLVNDSTATTRGANNNVQFYIKGETEALSTGNNDGNNGDDDDEVIDPGF